METSRGMMPPFARETRRLSADDRATGVDVAEQRMHAIEALHITRASALIAGAEEEMGKYDDRTQRRMALKLRVELRRACASPSIAHMTTEAFLETDAGRIAIRLLVLERILKEATPPAPHEKAA